MYLIKLINRQRRGFSVLEVLAVLFITAVIVSLSYLAFVSLSKVQVLEKDASALISLFEEARSLTLASKEASQYGVFISEDDNKAVLFKGNQYDQNDPDNEELLFNNSISASVNLVDENNDSVVFDRLKGTTSQHGFVILSLVNNPAETITLAIYPTGSSGLLP